MSYLSFHMQAPTPGWLDAVARAKPRFWNKLARVRQSEGEEAAERYSRKYKYAPVAPLDWRKTEV